MVRIIGIGVIVILLTLTAAGEAQAGNETYFIETFEQLEELARIVSGGDGAYTGEVYLINDIEALRPLTPIGDEAHMFCGLFDGRGHTISGLRIDVNGSFAGLFGCVGREGIIRNLTLENVLIRGERYTGAVAGYSAGLIERCALAGGRIIGRSKNEYGAATGGLVGLTDGTLRACLNLDADVYGRRCAGGIAGSLSAGEVYGSLSTGMVCSRYGGEASVGGLVGAVHSGGEIKSCISLSEVRAEKAFDAGGIAGSLFSGSIKKCVFLGRISGREAGAIAGSAAARAQIMGCFYDPLSQPGVGEGRQDGTMQLMRHILFHRDERWLLPMMADFE